ncbi:hypothetical protein QVD17_23361 [Tagetes erecta]|uniref:Uncharacterized protein n=1 Tax=Tagetes erecta TaxID=13708 RepID=A0AAD8KIX5_TARER|nr:hypothetical protein QVD17_23361 [Tagetes erecta]
MGYCMKHRRRFDYSSNSLMEINWSTSTHTTPSLCTTRGRKKGTTKESDMLFLPPKTQSILKNSQEHLSSKLKLLFTGTRLLQFNTPMYPRVSKQLRPFAIEKDSGVIYVTVET